MKYQITSEGTFIPEFRGNRSAPAADQIVVRYKMPTIAIKNRVRTKPHTKALADKDGKFTGVEVMVDKDDAAALREMLIGISGCSYEENGREKVLYSAKDLLEAPVFFEPLLKEIVSEFDKVLDEVELDEKN